MGDEDGGNVEEKLREAFEELQMSSVKESNKDHKEDKIQINSTNNIDNKAVNSVTIPSWLEACETPFSWHLQQERALNSEFIIMRTLEKLDDLLIEEPEFSLERFVSLLKLVLEYYITGDIDKCCENMKIVDGCLEEEIARNEECYQKVKVSLGHVVTATKAHVLYILGKEEESKKIAKCIIPVKIMADNDKAALSAMKARFFLYSGYENGEAVGVTYSREALELEPDNPEYEYLLAKMLRQQRRDALFSTEVPRDELKLLESAVKRDKDPKYLVYLAQVYRESAAQAMKQYRNHPNFNTKLKPSIDLMSSMSLEYYKEALSLSPESPAVLRRVGYGIMNLNKKYADYDLALDCLLKSLDILENQVTIHMLGTFYHRYGNDNKKALECFEKIAKTGSNAGLSDMIRVKWIMDPHNYDPTPDLEVGLSWKLKKKHHNQHLVQLGGYHLFIKRDFCKAAEYFKPVLLDDKDSPHMATFKSYFLKMHEPINLYRYLANEALLLIQKHKSNSSAEPKLTDEEEANAQLVALGLAEDILDLISQVHPEFSEMSPDEDLVFNLKRHSKEIEARWNQDNRGGNHFNSRGNRNYSGNNRGRGNNYRGGYRHGRPGSQDDNERRYFATNQRDRETDGDERNGSERKFNSGRGTGHWQRERGTDGDERNGSERKFNSGRGTNQRGHWHSRPRNEERRKDGDEGDHENWRKK